MITEQMYKPKSDPQQEQRQEQEESKQGLKQLKNIKDIKLAKSLRTLNTIIFTINIIGCVFLFFYSLLMSEKQRTEEGAILGSLIVTALAVIVSVFIYKTVKAISLILDRLVNLEGNV